MTTLALSLMLLGCSDVSEQDSDKQDSDKEDTFECLPDGTYVAKGDWPLFDKWTFSLRDGQLTDSFTDDPSTEQRSTLLGTSEDRNQFWLSRTTWMSGAMIETVLLLELSDCIDDTAVLVVQMAYTLFVDYNDLAASHVELHEDIRVQFSTTF